MRVFDILSLILTVLGTYAVFLSLRLLLPYYVVQHVNARLKQTEERLNEAEAENAIPSENEYRDQFASLHNQFSRMRMASNQHPRFLQQLCLASLDRLTYKLYTLYSRIGALQREVEIAIDQHQLASITIIRNVIATTLPAPAAVSPTVDVTEPSLPPPDACEALTINAEGPTCGVTRGLTYPPTLMATSQVVIGQHQPTSVVSSQRATATALPAPTAITVTRTTNVTGQTPPPAAYGILSRPPTTIGTSQMVMDENQLASVASNPSTVFEALPAPTTVITSPTITEPTLPPPAAHCLTTSDCPPSLKGPSQVVMDEHQLASAASDQSATATVPPTSTAIAVTPMTNVAELTDPLPA